MVLSVLTLFAHYDIFRNMLWCTFTRQNQPLASLSRFPRAAPSRGGFGDRSNLDWSIVDLVRSIDWRGAGRDTRQVFLKTDLPRMSRFSLGVLAT